MYSETNRKNLPCNFNVIIYYGSVLSLQLRSFPIIPNKLQRSISSTELGDQIANLFSPPCEEFAIPSKDTHGLDQSEIFHPETN